MDNDPKSLSNQDEKQPGVAMLQKWQFPNGIISPLMLAATPTIAKGDQYYTDVNGIFARLPIGANGSLYTPSSGIPSWLAPGTSGQVLTISSGVPSWQTLAIPVVPTDGWTPETATLTYASATSVTTSGTITAYTKGTRIKFTNNSITYYGTVISSSGSTINLALNSDYTIANSAITSPSYSYVANPQGYPGWFNWTPTYSAGGSMTFTSVSTSLAQFSIINTTCTLQLLAIGTVGGTPSFALRFTLPVAAVQRFGIQGSGLGANGGASTATIPSNFNTNSTTVLDVSLYNVANWTVGSATIGAAVSYQI